jgi:hypothetical protein
MKKDKMWALWGSRKPDGKNLLEDLKIQGRIIVKLRLRSTVRKWTGFL